MTAAAIIRGIRAAGGAISIADDRLKLLIPKSLADEIIPEIRAGKDAIRRALRYESGDPWEADDYRTLFEERAAIAEFDGGLSRDEAEAQARDDVVAEWRHRHPPEPTNPGTCAHCDLAIGEPGEGGVPFLAGDHGHVWLHHPCWQSWTTRRREEAEKALAALGIGAVAR